MLRRPLTSAGALTVWKGQGLNLLGVWDRGLPTLFLEKLEEWKQFFRVFFLQQKRENKNIPLTFIDAFRE